MDIGAVFISYNLGIITGICIMCIIECVLIHED